MQMLLNPVVPKDQWVCSVAQLYLTLCNPTDCSPWGSSVHRIIQARILEWVAISYSGGSSRLRDLICVSYLLHWQVDSLPLWPMVNYNSPSPLDCKEIQPVHPKGDQSWLFIGRTDVEAETPILWPPDAKIWLIGKDPDAGKDWGQEEKGTTEDEMVGWHHWLDGHGFGWTPGVGDGQGGLACCNSWGRKESDTTERLNWTDAYSFLAGPKVKK